MLKTTIRNKYK